MRLQTLLSRLFPPQHGTVLALAIAASIAGCVVLFIILQMLPGPARKRLIVLATFLAGLYYAAEFFWPSTNNPLTFALTPMGDFASVLAAFTVGLGIYSLIRIHVGNVARQRGSWGNSIVLLLCIVFMAIAGLWFEDSSNPSLKMIYRSLFRDVLANYDGAMFAILAFFIVSAAYRAFRIRSAEATLLMLAALVVMLGQVPLGQAITHNLPEKGYFTSIFRVENVSNWLLMWVNGPAQRAISFGLGVGALAIGLRVWLSLERGAYFEAKTEE